MNPSGEPGVVDWRSRLSSFYAVYNREKLADVDDILQRYKGKVCGAWAGRSVAAGRRQPPDLTVSIVQRGVSAVFCRCRADCLQEETLFHQLSEKYHISFTDAINMGTCGCRLCHATLPGQPKPAHVPLHPPR
jgi:hypothetical protein